MTWLRRFWPEALLAILLALPWAALFVLGLLWLWDNARVLEWALASAALLLAGLPLRAMVRRRAEARLQAD
ncbi:MAG: GTP-binding protein HSR1, partial [Alphaproteobacteria bacterium]|nr:GTP-binding protein HSR1 [Alphaproteobacteria bacterium]